MEPTSDIFRKEALEHHRAGTGVRGSLLRISPSWLRWAYVLLVGTVAVGFAFLIFGRVNEYGTGPAIIRARGRTALTARAAGTVSAIEVVPGQRVAAGDVLVRFDAANETSELEGIAREIDLQLMKTLRDPNDKVARDALTRLSAERQRAQSRLDDRSVRAPAGGTVADLRVRPAQYLAAGETVLTLTQDAAGFQVIAAVPGRYRPMVQAGSPLRLEVEGFKYAYQELTIESADTSVVGPAEVRRYLGQELSDAVFLEGPVFLVQASLPAASFTVDGRTYPFYDGMQGLARAKAREERIIMMLVPWLRSLTQPSPVAAAPMGQTRR